MAIRQNGVSVVCAGDLLGQDLRIPHYQRPYSWKPATAIQLLDDVWDAFSGRGPSQDVPFVLGAVILHDEGRWLDVVDGQQRLLTLRIIMTVLNNQYGHSLGANGESPVSRVRSALARRIKGWTALEREALAAFIRKRCQLVRIVTDDIDEAFRVFDSQNFRGKPLEPHDLLKAHHLREMRGESDTMMTAIVETWEAAQDEDLDRLFSVYLYRIARWSRGESAPGFTTHDIDMFKGISPANDTSPGARYHLAAQAAIPMLSAWGTAPAHMDERDVGRSRFQFDAPVLAGRPFFEMVTFMLEELKRLRKGAFLPEWEPFASFDLVEDDVAGRVTLMELPARSRYRYVSELYVAALLYYTNMFGDRDGAVARERLFAWAYTLRVGLLRVQFRSVDNLGRGEGDAASAFSLLRDASSGSVVHQLPASSEPRAPGHEKRLVAVLRALGAR